MNKHLVNSVKEKLNFSRKPLAEPGEGSEGRETGQKTLLKRDRD